MATIGRRAFLELTAAVPLAAALPATASLAERQAAAPGGGGLKKALYVSMLPKDLSYLEKFRLARAAGFDGIEVGTITDDAVAAEIKAASDQSGLVIHSVMNADHWKYPLSSPDPEVVNKSIAGMEASFRNAKLWGAHSILLVPGVVDAQTRYQDAWTRSQKVIRERIVPMAAQAKVVVGIEEVWNKFLISPLEMAHYVDEFASPWIKAYLDVGNMLFYGFPQDWARTLGPRISRVHVKDFKLDRRNGTFAWKNLGEGDVDWPAVRQALADVKYEGWVTAEIEGGDAAYLKDVAARMDRFFAGQKPVAAT